MAWQIKASEPGDLSVITAPYIVGESNALQVVLTHTHLPLPHTLTIDKYSQLSRDMYRGLHVHSQTQILLVDTDSLLNLWTWQNKLIGVLF